MATKAPSYTAYAAKLQAAFDAGADLSKLEKLIAEIPGFDVLRNDEGTPVQLIQAINYRDAGGKGVYVVPPTLPGDEGAVLIQTPESQAPEIGDTLLQAIGRGATDVIRREPSMGLDPENRQAVENLGVLGQYLYAPALDVGAGALTTVQAGLEGLARGGGQLMEDIGLLGLIENLTSVKQTPERAAEQLLGFLEAEGLRAPMGYVPGGAMIPQRARPVSPGRMAAALEQAKPVAPPRVPLPTAMETLAAPPRPTLPPIRPVTRDIPPPPKPDIEVTNASLARAQEALRSTPDETAVPVEFAGNINLSKLETTEDAKNLVNEVAKSNNEFIEARRGVVSVPEMENLADQVSLENLLGRKLGQAMNAEWIIAARRAVAATSENAISAARKWKENPADENLKNAALEAIMRQAAFQEQLSGATAEIGRAMRAMRETQAADRTDALKAIVGDITSVRDPKKINELLDLVGSLDDADAAAKFISDVAKPGMGDKMLEVWINGLLAGPYTHVVNSTSNALTALMKLPEELLAAGVGKITRSSDRITAREVQKRATGMVQGTLDGLRAANKVIKGEDLPADLSKTELIRRESISGVKGKIIRIPSRALEVQDELFKGISRRGELASLAYQRALKEAKGDKVELERLYKKYLDNPTKAMQKQADEFARYQTFQNDLIGWPKSVQEFARKHPGFRYLVPFIRTPVNILKYARDRSLLAPTTKAFWKDIRAGGRKRDQAVARLTMGAGITGTIGYMFGEGLVTGGGPSDPGERASLLATGWQPYSFKIGDTYYSYARMEPLSTVVGVTADFFTLQDYLEKDEAENIATLLPMSLAKNVFDKTFLQGISNFIEAVLYPERYGQKYLEGMAASIIPNVLPQIARGVDPTLRQTEGFLDVLQSRTPFLSKMLPARLDAWGDEIVRVGYTKPEDTEQWQALTAATNVLNPIRQSQVDKSSPIKSEVARLGMKISRPDKTMTLAGVDVELTPEEYASYIKQSGNMAKIILDNLVQTEAYKAMDSESKKDLILDTVRKSRSAFRQQTLMQAMQRELQELNQQ